MFRERWCDVVVVGVVVWMGGGVGGDVGLDGVVVAVRASDGVVVALWL